MRNKELAAVFRKTVRPADIILLILCTGLILFLSFRIYGKKGNSDLVEIRMKDDVWVYSLDTDRIIELKTDIGPIVIEIGDRSVRVKESCCEEKICVRTGAVSKPGQWIACLPSGVMITIISNGTEEGPDETAY